MGLSGSEWFCITLPAADFARCKVFMKGESKGMDGQGLIMTLYASLSDMRN
jgi:hypothetical protein